MKPELKRRAEMLRKQGYSMNAIQKELAVSKSTVSIWTREIRISKTQRERLSRKPFSRKAVEKRRQARIKNEEEKRGAVISIARNSIGVLSARELWLIGSALYWAEGGKTRRSLVRFTNSDPSMMRIVMRFFREVCKVPEEKFRVQIHLHSNLDPERARIYWSKITKIQKSRFYKTYIRRAENKNMKSSLPLGTCNVYVLSTELFLNITGWIEGISK